MRFLLFLAALPLWGLSNAVTIQETTGNNQTNLPVTISRYFAKGEVPAIYACVQPYVDGVAATSWQCERKNSHTDGSLRWALISLKIPSLIGYDTAEVDFRPSASTASGSGHTKADLLANASWNADMRFRFNAGLGAQFDTIVDARTMLNALTENAACSDPADSILRGLRTWTNGPVVTQWIVEDKCRTRTYDFGATHNGTQWNTPTNDSFRTLHPYFVLTAHWDYPSAGQVTVAVDFIVEQPWRSIYQNVKYRPRFRDQNLTHVVEERTVNDFDHWKTKTYMFSGWASTTSVPRTIQDLNLPYMEFTGVIPPYEQRPTGANATLMDNTSVDTALAFYRSQYLFTYNGEAEPFQYARGNVNCKSPYQTSYYCALVWPKNWQMSGLSPVYIPVPENYVQWLYIMGNPNVTLARKLDWWDTLVVGAAAIAGSTFSASIIDDLGTTQTYCGTWCTTTAYQSLKSFGMPVSMQAFPLNSGYSNSIPNWLRASSPAGPVCGNTAWPCNHNSYNWDDMMGNNAASHAQPLWFFPALVTGHPYYHEQLMRQASLQISHGAAGGSSMSTRNGNDFWVPYAQWRSRPQTMKIAIQATALAIGPMYEYFTWILRRNIAIEEGRVDVPASEAAFASGALSSWYDKGKASYMTNWGTQSYITANPTNFSSTIPENLATQSYVTPMPMEDSTVIYSQGSGWWMTDYQNRANGLAIALGEEYFRPYAKASSRYIQRAIQIAPFAFGDYTVVGAYLKPDARLEVLSATRDAGRNKLTLTFASPHGYSGMYQRGYLCCMDPKWTGGWNTKSTLNYGTTTVYTFTALANNGSGAIRATSAGHTLQTDDTILVSQTIGAPQGIAGTYTVTRISDTQFDLNGSTFVGPYTLSQLNWSNKVKIVDANTLEIPWTTSLTGTYNADGSGCCATNRAKLHWISFSINNPSIYQGPPQSWAEFDKVFPIEARELTSINSDYESSPLADRVAHYYASAMWLASVGLWDKTIAPDLYRNYQKFRSVKKYWDRQFAVTGSCVYGSCGSMGLAWGPVEKITNVQASAGYNKVLVKFQAPTWDAAKVGITTESIFLDSRDGSDTVATCVGRDCSAVFSATPGTSYRYRVTAGTNGGARVEGYVNAAGSIGGATTYTQNLQTPPGRGITKVTVENWLVPETVSSQTVSCASSCSVNISGFSGDLQNIRWTWKKTGPTGDVAIGQPGTKQIILPY